MPQARLTHLRRAALLCGTALAFPAAAFAQLAPNARPQGGNVVAGSASIRQDATLTQVNQASNRAIIDWRSFDVGRDQAVQFQQPSANALVLNRVTGPDPSTIAGRITANGQVVLVNQSGVVFTQGAQVEARSVIVSTADISNRVFMTGGRLAFDRPGRATARIENNGTITVRQAGLAALVAPQVANSGTINARLSRVVLAGAETHAIDLYGDGLLSLDVTSAVRTAPGNRAALVTNTGTIEAEGGSIRLTAAAADGIVQDLVRAGGRIAANTDPATGRTGRVLVAGTGGTVRVEGELGAVGLAAGSRGGRIQVLADRVQLADTARLNASGGAGGGRIAIGTGRTRLAQRTEIAAGAVVRADATARGNGGEVRINSTERTTVAGTVSVRGGPLGGNGGSIEVSGRQGFALTGTLDTAAPRGAPGTVLLDPTNLAVVGEGQMPPGYDAYVLNTTVNGTAGALTLQADNNLAVLAAVNKPTGGLTLQAGNAITLGASITLGAGDFSLIAGAGGIQQTVGPLAVTNLLIQSGGDVALNQPNNRIQMLSASSVTGSLALTDATTLTLAGDIVVSNTLTLQTGFSGIHQNAGSRVLAATLDASNTADILLTGDNRVGEISGITASYGLTFRNATSLRVVGPVTADNTVTRIDVAGGDLTVDALVSGGYGAVLRASGNLQLGANGVVNATNTNSTVTLYAGYDFVGNLPSPTAPGGITLAGVVGSNAVSNGIELAAGTGGIVQTAGSLRGAALSVQSGGVALLDRAGSQTGTLNAVASIAGSATGALVLDNGTAALQVGVVTTGPAVGVSGADVGLRTTGDLTLLGNVQASTTGTASLRVGNLFLNGHTVSGNTVEIAPATARPVALPVSSETPGVFPIGVTDLALLQSNVLRVGATTFRGVTTTTATDISVIGPLARPGTLDLRSTGNIGQTAGSDLNVGTLAGVAGGLALLTNPGNRITNVADLSAGLGIGLTDATALTIIGSLSSPQTVRLIIGGLLQETGVGRIAAGRLNVTATGAVNLPGDNAVVQLGGSSSGGSFALSDDVAQLTVPGGQTVNAGAALSLSNVGNLTIDGTVTGTATTLLVDRTLTVNGFSAIARTGNLNLTGNQVVVAGLLSAAGSILLNAAGGAQLGGTASAPAGTFQIASPNVLFTGLNANATPVVLQLGGAGTASGNLSVAALNVAGGSGVGLTGSIAGVTGGGAAAIGTRSTAGGTPAVPPPNPGDFLFNGCPIAVAVCAPVIVPIEPIMPIISIGPSDRPPLVPEPEVPTLIVTLASNPETIVGVLDPSVLIAAFAALRPPAPDIAFSLTRDRSEEQDLAPPNVRGDDY